MSKKAEKSMHHMVLFLLSSKHTKLIYQATSQDGACEKGVRILNDRKSKQSVLPKAGEEFAIVYQV